MNNTNLTFKQIPTGVLFQFFDLTLLKIKDTTLADGIVYNVVNIENGQTGYFNEDDEVRAI